MLSDPRFAVTDPVWVSNKSPAVPATRIPKRERSWPFRRFIRSKTCPGAGRETDGEFKIVQIVVRDNNVDQALKALKKKMQREGLFREMKRRDHFEKPSERKAREKAEAVRRARKLARKRAQREGLLPKI